MRKIIAGIVIGIVIAIPSFSFAKGQWSDWWTLQEGRSGQVMRFYDHENKLVCWVAGSRKLATSPSIDCNPSFELNHPNTRR